MMYLKGGQRYNSLPGDFLVCHQYNMFLIYITEFNENLMGIVLLPVKGSMDSEINIKIHIRLSK